ncbi:MAG: hypothetical protein ABFR65_10650, partial [Pseudomonadota bacterium]
MIVEHPTPLGRAAQILAQQVQHLPVFDGSRQPLQQEEVVDRGVIGFDVGAHHEAMAGQAGHGPADSCLGPAVSLDVGAAGLNFQKLAAARVNPQFTRF